MTNFQTEKTTGSRIRRNARFEWSVLLAAAFVLLVLTPAFSSASVITLSSAVTPAWQASVHAPVWNSQVAAIRASAPGSCGSALDWLRRQSAVQTPAPALSIVSYSDRTGRCSIELPKTTIDDFSQVTATQKSIDVGHLASISAASIPAALTRDDASRVLLPLALTPHEGSLLSGTRTNRYHE